MWLGVGTFSRGLKTGVGVNETLGAGDENATESFADRLLLCGGEGPSSVEKVGSLISCD
jgi:hypothetical protein